MKKLLLISALLFAIAANAQSPRSHFFYFSWELDPFYTAKGDLRFFPDRNEFEGNISLNYILDEKLVIQLGKSYHVLEGSNLPMDFYDFHSRPPFNYYNSYQLLAGRSFRLEPSGKVRLNLLTGLAYMKVRTSKNWEYHERVCNGWYFLGLSCGHSQHPVITDRYYSYDRVKSHTLGMVFNSRLEVPIGRALGLNASLKTIFGADRPILAFEVGMMVGLVNKGKYRRVGRFVPVE